MVMRFQITIHAQCGRMRSDLSQHPTLDEKPQIVVDRGQRNRRNAPSDRSVNFFWRMVSLGSDDGLIDHLTLVRDRQTVLRGQLTELFMCEAQHYRTTIIIKRPGSVSPPALEGSAIAHLSYICGRYLLSLLRPLKTGCGFVEDARVLFLLNARGLSFKKVNRCFGWGG